MRSAVLLILISGLALGLNIPSASAQTLGPFRWQLAPYCNVLTLAVEVKTVGFHVEGYDDLCGAPKRAPATGTAQFNPDGTISLVVTTTRPDGFAVQQTATITAAALTGTWRDEFDNSGTFAFNAPSPMPGTPRPITLAGNYQARGLGGGTDGASEISFGRRLPFVPQIGIVRGAAPTAACPGSSTMPTAAPGFLCVYERTSSGVTTLAAFNAIFDFTLADRTGAVITTSGIPGAQTLSAGTWALTLQH